MNRNAAPAVDNSPRKRSGFAAWPSLALLVLLLPGVAFAQTSLNVRDFGAVGDGVTDDGPAFQAALNASSTVTGSCVGMDNGVFRLNTPIVLSRWACLQGAGWSENIPGIHAQYSGSWLKVTHTTAPAITLSNGAAKGSSFRGFGVIQTQPFSAPGWVPTLYEPIFSVTNVGGEVVFEDLYLPGVDKGIYSLNSGRTTLRHIRGQTFTYFAFLDNAGGSDTNHIDDVHIWTYWTSNAPVVTWQQANGVVLKFGRVDSVQADHIFGLGYKSCLQTTGNAASGPATGIDIAALNCDASLYPVWDTDTTSAGLVGYGSDLHIGSLHCGGITGSQCIQLDGKNARLSVKQIEPVTIDNSIVNMTDTSSALGNVVQIGAINAQGASVQFNLSGTAPAFDAPSKPGVPHQISLSTNMVPSTGGYTASNTVSGLINKNLVPGAAIVRDAGNQTWVTNAVTSGSTYQLPNGITKYFANGSGITSIIYALPDVPIDGSLVTVIANADQTGVSFTSGATIVGAPAKLFAGQGVTFQYLQPIGAWRRIDGAAQLGCGDLSNAAASCATDATNASNIGSGTLAGARLGASSLGSSGYTTLGSDGPIFQWGGGATGSPSATSAAVTFPIAFPNAAFKVQVTAVTGITQCAFTVTGASITTVGFTTNTFAPCGSATNFSWFAVGH